jgi:hypothetical protein
MRKETVSVVVGKEPINGLPGAYQFHVADVSPEEASEIRAQRAKLGENARIWLPEFSMNDYEGEDASLVSHVWNWIRERLIKIN